MTWGCEQSALSLIYDVSGKKPGQGKGCKDYGAFHFQFPDPPTPAPPLATSVGRALEPSWWRASVSETRVGGTSPTHAADLEYQPETAHLETLKRDSRPYAFLS